MAEQEQEQAEKLMSACRRVLIEIEEFEAAVKDVLGKRVDIVRSPEQNVELPKYLAKYNL